MSLLYDCAVVGGGVMGLSAAYHMAKLGHKTICLEQFSTPHSRGSSHGSTRISRRVYTQHPLYTHLMHHAYNQWDTLQQEAKSQLFVPTGALFIVGPEKLQECAKSLSARGLPYRLMDNQALNEEYRGLLSYPQPYAGLMDQSGGILKADKCLQALAVEFVRNGGEFRDATSLLSLNQPSPTAPVSLKTSSGTLAARKAILCLGPWAAQFLPTLGLKLPLTVQGLSVCYWEPKERATFQLGTLPILMFYDHLIPHSHLYGVPALEHDGLFKFCYHNGPFVDPDRRDERPGGSESRSTFYDDYLGEHVTNHLPGINSAAPAIIDKCIYTWTPDANPVLDRHPKMPGVVIAAGFSGHGFKLAPVVGNILADLALDQKPQFPDLDIFALNRFSA